MRRGPTVSRLRSIEPGLAPRVLPLLAGWAPLTHVPTNTTCSAAILALNATAASREILWRYAPPTPISLSRHHCRRRHPRARNPAPCSCIASASAPARGSICTDTGNAA